jgi:hypothetical protein
LAEPAGSPERPNKNPPAPAPALDTKSILDHNRVWLRPDFKGLQSVSFQHVTGPKRIVEAFD